MESLFTPHDFSSEGGMQKVIGTSVPNPLPLGSRTAGSLASGTAWRTSADPRSRGVNPWAGLGNQGSTVNFNATSPSAAVNQNLSSRQFSSGRGE